jgi:protein-L-isoaspartate(D-aspartate) O-methyltransferase
MSPATLHAATARLLRLGYTNFEGRTGDGYYGWPEPGLRFDAIVVRWSLDHVPTTLLRQLKPGGRLVVPVGPDDDEQDLVRLVKKPDHDVQEWHVMPVRFAPMPGGPRI